MYPVKIGASHTILYQWSLEEKKMLVDYEELQGVLDLPPPPCDSVRCPSVRDSLLGVPLLPKLLQNIV